VKTIEILKIATIVVVGVTLGLAAMHASATLIKIADLEIKKHIMAGTFEKGE